MTMKAAIYGRVSTDKQTTDNQIRELMEVARRHQWTVEAIYSDVISGAADKRPELDKMMEAVHRKEMDIILAWDVSRLGRSLQHLVSLLSEIHAKGINLFLHQSGIDTTTPSGKAMFGMLSVFSQFEREMISERVRSGLERARAQGKKLGRPAIPKVTHDAILKYRKQGLSHRKIGQKVGVSHTAVQQSLERRISE
jgi:DNA invertase Pin-like site-specific DNA recombinase